VDTDTYIDTDTVSLSLARDPTCRGRAGSPALNRRGRDASEKVSERVARADPCSTSYRDVGASTAGRQCRLARSLSLDGLYVRQNSQKNLTTRRASLRLRASAFLEPRGLITSSPCPGGGPVVGPGLSRSLAQNRACTLQFRRGTHPRLGGAASLSSPGACSWPGRRPQRREPESDPAAYVALSRRVFELRVTPPRLEALASAFPTCPWCGPRGQTPCSPLLRRDPA